MTPDPDVFAEQTQDAQRRAAAGGSADILSGLDGMVTLAADFATGAFDVAGAVVEGGGALVAAAGEIVGAVVAGVFEAL